jgi:hypothetical protein
MPFLAQERADAWEYCMPRWTTISFPWPEMLCAGTLVALRIEAMYGEQVDVSDESLLLDGQEVGARAAPGRLAMYCRLPDGRGGCTTPGGRVERAASGADGELAKAWTLPGAGVVELIPACRRRVRHEEGRGGGRMRKAFLR